MGKEIPQWSKRRTDRFTLSFASSQFPLAFCFSPATVIFLCAEFLYRLSF